VKLKYDNFRKVSVDNNEGKDEEYFPLKTSKTALEKIYITKGLLVIFRGK